MRLSSAFVHPFAMDVCNIVVNCKFNGLYVDANAINPATSMIIAEKLIIQEDMLMVGLLARLQ